MCRGTEMFPPTLQGEVGTAGEARGLLGGGAERAGLADSPHPGLVGASRPSPPLTLLSSKLCRTEPGAAGVCGLWPWRDLGR